MTLPLIGAIAAIMVLSGLLLGIAAFTVPVAPSRRESTPRQRPRLLARLTRRTRTVLLISIAVGLIAAMLTGWMILVLLIPAATVAAPYLFDTKTETRAQKRVEAIGKWVSALSGSMGAGASLEQALKTSMRSTSDEIRPEVSRLVARINSRIETRTALRAFADDLDDAMGDKVVAALMLGAERRGALSGVLADLAGSLEEDLAARRGVIASRASARSTARNITGLMVVVVGGLVLFGGDYMAPYRTPLGQILFTVQILIYAALLIWMKRLSAVKRPPRFLGTTSGGGR